MFPFHFLVAYSITVTKVLVLGEEKGDAKSSVARHFGILNECVFASCHYY